jgi:hypothetical protein
LDAAYNRQFGYDDLGRLTTTSTGAMLWGTRTLIYDAMGNLKKTTIGATLSYSGSLPKLTSVTEAGVTTPVTYDPAGNDLTALKTTISPRNNIAQMSTTAMDYLYKYDGRGVRTWTSETPKPATGTTTRRYHFYTPDLRFLARTDYTVTASSTTVARTIEPIWFSRLSRIRSRAVSRARGRVKGLFAERGQAPCQRADAGLAASRARGCRGSQALWRRCCPRCARSARWTVRWWRGGRRNGRGW